MNSATMPLLTARSDSEEGSHPVEVIVSPSREPFQVNLSQISGLVDEKDQAKLAELGGVDGIGEALRVSLFHGPAGHLRAALREEFGENKIPAKPKPSLVKMMWEALKDKTLILLTAAAVVSLILGIIADIRDGEGTGWIEGVAILSAVVVVVLVNSINDYRKERQFQSLSALNDEREVTVLAGDGGWGRISVFDLVVGDVLKVEPGDVLPVDGILFEASNVTCDESSVTGESDVAKKSPEKDCFMLSGTKVTDGVGKMLATAVGPNSFHGRMMMALRVDSGSTPLQLKLDALAETIARIGASIALFLLVILTLKFVVGCSIANEWPSSASEIMERLTAILIQGIVIVVVAVPEGLPMAVTLALAFATSRMLADNNLVRVLEACEIMGNATTICADKTGMAVVRGSIAGEEFDPSNVRLFEDKLAHFSKQLVLTGIAANSTAFASIDPQTRRPTMVGSKTEIALIEFAQQMSTVPIEKIRALAKAVQVVPFSSERKSMSTLVEIADGQMLRLYIKGASEIVLARCDTLLRSNATVPMTAEDLAVLGKFISTLAEDSLRTIALAYKDIRPEDFASDAESLGQDKLTLIGILGIEDELREGVSGAVRQCQKAGIFVRMVTGDNALTAQSIARRCGILQRGGLVMEGARFRSLGANQLNEIVPRLQVLARSSPFDKQILIRQLRSMGEVVAVTGDGTNDGPALKAAHVGFAMGIAGTEVAKEAASIILMDDNFTSIVKAAAWGRCVNDSVRKFLQFQLTVNIAAVVTAVTSALFDSKDRSVLTAVQLLWLNLIMDSLAALALATDKPTPELLDRHPDPPEVPLISFAMWRMIIGQASFQIVMLLSLLMLGRRVYSVENATLLTFAFNTFVFMQLFNEINCRVLDNRLNVFKDLFENPIFPCIWFGCAIMQFLIVLFGGLAFSTVPLSWPYWLLSVSIGSLALPLAALIKLLPDWRGEEARQSERRIFQSPERMQWQAAITDVRANLKFFTALRRARRSVSVLNSDVEESATAAWDSCN